LATPHIGILSKPDFFAENLKSKLENYILKFNGKVRLIRNAERQGLIRTRVRGAVESRGEVVVFLDAHCEVGTNWLPPLLGPIYHNRFEHPGKF
jgi:polypeptide N-acetylgalactosaminyltransferase